jgi:hypothetical protein
VFLLTVLAVSVIVGMARGGSLAAFGRHNWCLPLLPAVALALQVIGFMPDENASAAARTFAAGLHVISYALALLFILANRGTPWLWLMAAGLVANAAVILANGGFMPVHAETALRTPASEVPGPRLHNNAALMGPDTRLWFLADILMMPRFLGVRWAFSIGDLVIAVATFAAVQRLMAAHSVRRRAAT